MDSLPWVEKYRPRKLEEIIQTQNLLDLFRNSILTENMTHFIFYGPPGTGKTSAIIAMGREIFKEYFPTRVIEFNASDDRGINAVRKKITNEAKKFVSEIICEDGTIIPPYKIIILDEADSLTDEAQDALRVIIEQYSTVTRFCFICNYISKITDAIKSRCTAVYFKKLDHDSMINKLNEIANKESIELSSKVLDTIIDVSNGDMRKAIMLLQNTKYLYCFKKNFRKTIGKMPLEILKYIGIIKFPVTQEINNTDIYDIAASIDIVKAHKIINMVLTCQKISEVVTITKEIIASGYPVDNILVQLNKAVLETDKLNNLQKARIIHYSGKILYRIKECANEYIQLLDYLSCINGVQRKITTYNNMDPK
jgi:replication factor C subunit 2/4